MADENEIAIKVGTRSKSGISPDMLDFDAFHQDKFARATLDFVWRVIRQPGGRELINTKIEQMRRESLLR